MTSRRALFTGTVAASRRTPNILNYLEMGSAFFFLDLRGDDWAVFSVTIVAAAGDVVRFPVKK